MPAGQGTNFIEIQGAKELADKLAEDKTAKVQRATGTYVNKLKRAIKTQAPVKTGKLQRGIHSSSTGQLQWTIAEKKMKVPYGYIQREGFVPGGISHTGYIFPKRKKALYWAGLGHPIAYVGRPITNPHPGIRPNKYHERALFASIPDTLTWQKKIADIYTLKATAW